MHLTTARLRPVSQIGYQKFGDETPSVLGIEQSRILPTPTDAANRILLIVDALLLTAATASAAAAAKAVDEAAGRIVRGPATAAGIKRRAASAERHHYAADRTDAGLPSSIFFYTEQQQRRLLAGDHPTDQRSVSGLLRGAGLSVALGTGSVRRPSNAIDNNGCGYYDAVNRTAAFSSVCREQSLQHGNQAAGPMAAWAEQRASCCAIERHSAANGWSA